MGNCHHEQSNMQFSGKPDQHLTMSDVRFGNQYLVPPGMKPMRRAWGFVKPETGMTTEL